MQTGCKHPAGCKGNIASWDFFSFLTCYVLNNTVPEALSSTESGERVWSLSSSRVKNVGVKTWWFKCLYKKNKCNNLSKTFKSWKLLMTFAQIFDPI